MNKIEFANLLVTARNKAGLKPIQVYTHLKVPQSTFSSWETGISQPDGNTLIKLLTMYKVGSLSEFLGEENTEFSTEEFTIIENYRKLGCDGKKMIRIIIDAELDRMDKNKTSTFTMDFTKSLCNTENSALTNFAVG